MFLCCALPLGDLIPFSGGGAYLNCSTKGVLVWRECLLGFNNGKVEKQTRQGE